jgi:hypothetical protein
MNALQELADACVNGACNSGALIRSLGKAIDDLPHGQVRTSPEVKVIVGHISFLIGESLGPTPEALQAYYEAKEKARVAALPAVN